LAIDAATTQVIADAPRRAALVGCEPQVVEDACVDAFLKRFGRLAWRRTLTHARVERYGALCKDIAIRIARSRKRPPLSDSSTLEPFIAHSSPGPE
jgi:hypothetical protein